MKFTIDTTNKIIEIEKIEYEYLHELADELKRILGKEWMGYTIWTIRKNKSLTVVRELWDHSIEN